MSNRLKLNSARREAPHPEKDTFFHKYMSIISLVIGSSIGLLFWYLFIWCGNRFCVRHSYPIPSMGISAFLTWCIFIAVFKK